MHQLYLVEVPHQRPATVTAFGSAAEIVEHAANEAERSDSEASRKFRDIESPSLADATMYLGHDLYTCQVLADNEEYVGGWHQVDLVRSMLRKLRDESSVRDMTDDEIRAKLEGIAHAHLDLDTLKERGRDALDFYDLSVASIAAALRAAYDQGRKDAMRVGGRS